MKKDRRKDMNAIESKTSLLKIGIMMLIFSNPGLYLTVGVLFIDIQNLFGANIDRRSISFNSEDPFIQAMQIVSTIGLALVIYALWKRSRRQRIA